MTAFAKTFGGTSGIIFGIVISVMVIGFCCCCSWAVLIGSGDWIDEQMNEIYQEVE